MKVKTQITPSTESPLPFMAEAPLISSPRPTGKLQVRAGAAPSLPVEPALPLLPVAEVIAKTTGVCSDLATLVCLSATASAVGPAFVLETPLCELVNSSLHLLIPSQFDPGIRSALGMAFGTYRDSQRKAAQDASRIPKKQLEEELAAVVARSRALSLIEQTFERTGNLQLPKGTILSDLIDDPLLLGYLEGGFDPTGFRDRISVCLDRRREEVTSALEKVDERAHPSSLLEPIRLGDYSGRHLLCKDRGLFSLDDYGIGIEELLGGSKASKREVGGLWSAAHDGRLLVTDGRARPGDWLAGISLVSTDLFKRFLTDKHLVSTGYPQRSLIVVPKAGVECVSIDDKGKSVMEGFSRKLLGWASYRRRNFGEKLQIARDAAAEIDVILADQRRVCADHPELADFNQHRAVQTLKLALLLHLAREGKTPRTVASDTIRQARELMARTLERTLGAQASAVVVENETGTLEVQLEMIHTKLKIKGPMTRRQLARSFHKVDMGHLHSLVELACDRGLIEQKGSQLRLPDKTE